MKTKILFLLLPALCLAALQVSCGKRSPSAPLLPATEKNTLTLAEASDGTCLSIPRYALALRTLNPHLAVMRASTRFELTSNKPIRPEFRQLMAYATFQFELSELGPLAEFDGFEQNGCEALTYRAADGSSEVYKIKEATAESLIAESESGRVLEYRWLSEQGLQVRVRYEALDLPCTGRSAFVDYTRVFDWSGEMPRVLDASSSSLAVEDEYVKLVAKAVGYDVDELYLEESGTTERPARRVLLTGKLLEMARMPVRSDVISCVDHMPQPPPPPEEEPPEEDPPPEENPPPEDGDPPVDPDDPPPTDDLPRH